MKKLEWHQRNIDFIQKHAFERGRLPFSYLEVVDADVPESFELLRQKNLAPNCYLAVNDDPLILFQHPAVTPYQMIGGDAFDVGLRLSKLAGSLPGLRTYRIPKPVGVFNFDLQDAIASDGSRPGIESSRFWILNGQKLFEIVRNTHDALGTCTLILNLSSRAQKHREAIEANTRWFLERFGGHFEGLDFEAMLGNDPGAFDRGAKGTYDAPRCGGAYELYKKTLYGTPMLTLRVHFAGGKAVW